MKKQSRRNRTSLLVLFALIIFGILLLSLGLAALVVWLLVETGAIRSYSDLPSTTMSIALYMGLISLVIGTVLAFTLSNIPLKPVNNIVNMLNRLAAGDFAVRIRLKKPYSNFSVVSDMGESFNKMAAELEQTELLRSDFVNNFAHEFKTPIVSIAGFAKVLRRGNLSEEEQKQYIGVIEEESLRLADMATNLLNLSRVENQQLLSDVKEYNLSEQLRSCVLLLENKWEEKNLELNLDFEEYTISASEELLRQAWINLIDNAVKFSPPGGSVSVGIAEADGTLTVTISNTGSSIAPENLEKIFHKFYQEDESHSGKGNGIGLAIVERVVRLHGGEVSADSREGVTTFTVRLPKEQ